MAFPELDLASPRQYLITGVPEGADALWLNELVQFAPGRQILHVSRDDARMTRFAEALSFFCTLCRKVGFACLGLLALRQSFAPP